jgi:putative ATP-binding cassette transporter
MSLGEVMQAASAFTIVQAAFNWLVDNYPRLADWTASARRVSTLMLAFDGLERAETGVGRIVRESKGKDAALRLNELSITLDDGTAVVDEAEVAVMPGERVLIVGDSGSGKSTLIRAIAGLWPWGEGKIEVQKDSKIMFLPQRPYIPVGSLRRAAIYPDAADSRSAEDIGAALERVGLAHLVSRLEEEAPWDQTLSGGEKQRLAFARIILQQPDIIIMDEATAALDPQSQNQLMELLLQQPERTTLISVGHRPELELFHERKIVLERRRGGTRLVSDVHLEDRPNLRRFVRKWMRRGQAAPEAA